MAIKTTDLEWATGFFEGEGCAAVYSPRQHQRKDGITVVYKEPTLIVSNCDEQLVNEFKKIVTLGNIHKQYPKQRSPYYRYVISGSGAQTVASKLLPYCISNYKRRQLEKVIGMQCEVRKFIPTIDWVAGIFEAEGFAGVYKHRNRLEEHVIITNTQKDMIDAVKNTIGFGTILMKPKSAINPKWRDAYDYSVDSKSARTFASILLPFVRSLGKRRQLLSFRRLAESRHEQNIVLTISPGGYYVNKFFNMIIGEYRHADYKRHKQNLLPSQPTVGLPPPVTGVGHVANVEVSAKMEECPDCHEDSLIESGGCKTCQSCGYSKCQ